MNFKSFFVESFEFFFLKKCAQKVSISLFLGILATKIMKSVCYFCSFNVNSKRRPHDFLPDKT